MYYSCICDHLRPRGVLSACDLLAVGSDLEWASCVFVGHSVFTMYYVIEPLIYK